MVGDAEQPALRIGDRPGRRRRLHRLQHGFLNHILAIDDRAGHPRAVAVQPRPELAQELLHGLMRGRGWCVASSTFRQAEPPRHGSRDYASSPGLDKRAGRALRALPRALGSNSPAPAPAKESIAATPVAAAKPWLKAKGVAWLPARAKTTTASATPKAPPS